MIRVYHRQDVSGLLDLFIGKDPLKEAASLLQTIADDVGTGSDEHKPRLLKVAKVASNDMGEAFDLTNHIDSSWTTNKGVVAIGRGKQRSTSVGDILVDQMDRAYIVHSIGFKQIQIDVSTLRRAIQRLESNESATFSELMEASAKQGGFVRVATEDDVARVLMQQERTSVRPPDDLLREVLFSIDQERVESATRAAADEQQACAQVNAEIKRATFNNPDLFDRVLIWGEEARHAQRQSHRG